MNPAVSPKKTIDTATNMRSPIAATDFLLIFVPRSEVLRLHERKEEVDEEPGGADARQRDHDGAGHS